MKAVKKAELLLNEQSKETARNPCACSIRHKMGLARDERVPESAEFL